MNIRAIESKIVSIVLPTFNCAHFLSRAVQSVLDQTYIHWELLIIDNYSIDNTVDVVKIFQDQRIRFLQIHNKGVIAKSRNLGIREAKGRWVAFLDADDWWCADKLDASVRALLLGHDFVYHDLIRKGPSKCWIHGRFARTRNLNTPIFDDLLFNGNGIINSSVVVKRSLLMQIGYASEDPSLVAVEDYDYWLRIAKKTEKFFRLQKAYGYYWIDNNSVSRSTNAFNYLNRIRDLYFTDLSSKLPVWYIFLVVQSYIREKNYKQALFELSKMTCVNAKYYHVLKYLILKSKIYFYLSRKRWH